jgi:penicillin amidase
MSEGWRRRLGGWLARAVKLALTARSRAALPAHQGVLGVRGMLGGARVVFDAHGVPHIRAAGDGDAFAALGVCHALDRFFQMDLMRRALSGGTSAVVGERPLGDLGFPPFGAKRTTVDADRLLLALDVVPSAERTLAHADDEGRGLLEAYTAGVNAGLEVVRRRRPLEHRLLGLELLPWKPVDSLIVAKGMALGLSFKWRSAPVLAAVAERLAAKPEHLESLLPRSPQEACVAQARWFVEGVGGALAFLPAAPAGVGSNAFLLGAGRSRSGSPLLANDPHLQLALPGVWYLASVRGGRYAAVGATMPGAPGVVIGRTPTLAWSVTNAMLDDADVWIEELDGTGTRHRVDGQWRELATTTHEIRRRGAAPVVFRLRRTYRGPLLSDAFPGYEGPPLSLRATWMEPGRDLEAFLGLGRARAAAEVPAAVAGYGSPAQNLLYADRHEAAWRLMGRVPQRAGGGNPALPRDGRTSAQDWAGEVPAGELPAARLGRDDQLVSANHPQVDGGYPHYLSHLYEPDYRARRIAELLGTRQDLVLDDLARIQRDAHDLGAKALREAVLVPQAEAVRRQRPSVARALDHVLAWDGSEEAHTAARCAHLLYHHLARRVFGPLLGRRCCCADGQHEPARRPAAGGLARSGRPWLALGARATVLGEALRGRAARPRARGLTFDSPWGAAHTLTLHHPAGGAPFLGPTFSRGPFPLPGGPFAVCSGQYAHDKPLRVTVGASYRQLIDLADPEASARMMTFGGQSGQVGSPHYDDLTPLWLAGTWLPMRLETEPEGGEVLTLEPR